MEIGDRIRIIGNIALYNKTGEVISLYEGLNNNQLCKIRLDDMLNIMGRPLVTRLSSFRLRKLDNKKSVRLKKFSLWK